MEHRKKQAEIAVAEENTKNMVSVPMAKYERMVNAQFRFGMLRERRLREAKTTGYPIITEEDFLLGNDVVNALQDRIAELAK